jgi:hypothetical protein
VSLSLKNSHVYIKQWLPLDKRKNKCTLKMTAYGGQMIPTQFDSWVGKKKGRKK